MVNVDRPWQAGRPTRFAPVGAGDLGAVAREVEQNFVAVLGVGHQLGQLRLSAHGMGAISHNPEMCTGDG